MARGLMMELVPLLLQVFGGLYKSVLTFFLPGEVLAKSFWEGSSPWHGLLFLEEHLSPRQTRRRKKMRGFAQSHSVVTHSLYPLQQRPEGHPLVSIFSAFGLSIPHEILRDQKTDRGEKIKKALLANFESTASKKRKSGL